MNITRQINNRKIGKSPSQLGEQSIPIYGDKATATSETKPLTWRLAHYDSVLDLATYESLKGFEGLKNALAKSCLLYTSPSPRDLSTSRMPSSA